MQYVRSVLSLCETYFILLSLRYVISAVQPHSVESTLPFELFWIFLNYASLTFTPALFYVFSTHFYLFHVGGHSTLQRDSGGRGTHFQDHDSGYTESPVKLMRLTRGVSISLPSSPLLPRQADIVPSQSCMKFTGGFNWNSNSNKNKTWSHYEQLRMTRSCASGNICKNSTMLSWVCLDYQRASVHSAVPYMWQQIQEHTDCAPRAQNHVTDCQSKWLKKIT